MCSTYLRSISKSPMVVPNSSIPTTSLPIESAASTVTVHNHGGPEKREAEAIIIDKWPEPTEFRSWKISVINEVSISQSRYATDWWSWGCLEYWRLHHLSIHDRKTNTGFRESWFQDCKRTQQDPTRELQETRRGHLRADRLHGWSTTSSK